MDAATAMAVSNRAAALIRVLRCFILVPYGGVSDCPPEAVWRGKVNYALQTSESATFCNFPHPNPLFGIIWGMTKGEAILAVAMEKAVPPVARFMGTGERTRNARRRANPAQNGQDAGSPPTRKIPLPMWGG